MIILNRFLVIFLFSIFFLSSCSFNNDKKEIICDQNMAAFDIGSGTTKLKVFSVNVCEKKINKVIIYSTLPVGYSQDLKDNNGKFSAEIIEYGTSVIDRFIKVANSFKVSKIIGVATSAFRISSNGKMVVESWNKKFGLNFRVIDQKEEALIGYDSVRMHDSQKYAVWDIGGGSMQLVENSEGQPFIYLGNIASVTFKNKLLERINKKGMTPNPMSKTTFSQAINLSMELFTEEIKQKKLKNFGKGIRFIGIGGLHKSLLPDGKDKYTLEEMHERADRFIGKTDEQINSKYSDTMVSNIALVIGFMKIFNINEVYVQNVVLSDGLIYQELHY